MWRLVLFSFRHSELRQPNSSIRLTQHYTSEQNQHEVLVWRRQSSLAFKTGVVTEGWLKPLTLSIVRSIWTNEFGTLWYVLEISNRAVSPHFLAFEWWRRRHCITPFCPWLKAKLYKEFNWVEPALLRCDGECFAKLCAVFGNFLTNVLSSNSKIEHSVCGKPHSLIPPATQILYDRGLDLKF